jgi:hypothetical protein
MFDANRDCHAQTRLAFMPDRPTRRQDGRDRAATDGRIWIGRRQEFGRSHETAEQVVKGSKAFISSEELAIMEIAYHVTGKRGENWSWPLLSSRVGGGIQPLPLPSGTAS